MSRLVYGVMVLLLALLVLICFHFISLRISELEHTVREHEARLNKIQFITDNNLEREQWILEEVKAIVDKHFATKLFIPVKKNVFIAVETEE